MTLLSVPVLVSNSVPDGTMLVLDRNSVLSVGSGSSPKSTRSAKHRFNDSSGHASRGRCGRCDYYGGEYVRNVSGMAHMRTLAEAKKGIERFRRTGSPYQAHGVD